MAVLELRGVSKKFGGLVAVSDFTLRLEEGELAGLIGPNGAGKTTVFNMITGIYRPTSGEIMFGAVSIAGKEPHAVSQMGIGRTFQNLRLFKDLTVLENVMISAQVNEDYSVWDALFRSRKFRYREMEIREEARHLLNLIGLERIADSKAKSLPYGYQRKLEIARALALKPRLLLLDEPAAGMNPDESLDLMRFIGKIHRDFGLTVLLIEHHMEVVMGLCERILVLNFGRTIAEGNPSEIQNNSDVIAAYLG